jgi:hypothetical protein
MKEGKKSASAQFHFLLKFPAGISVFFFVF